MRAIDVATNGASLRGFKGGSGGSQRQPVESPDSLISIEQVRILDLIGEGDIVGLVDGVNSIYLDEAPGSSYPSLQWDFRLGTQDQTFMPGFPAVESEINVGVNLLATSPYVRAVTNLTVSALRINFALGRFAQQNPSNGDTTGCRVEFAIDLAQGLGEFQEIKRSAFDGKTTTGYSRGVRVDLTYPAPAGGWRVRVRRITPDSTSSNISDVVTIRSVTEIIDYKFRYPNSALVGVNFDAEAFGGKIPKRSYHIKGRIVSVPTNYDPVARTYTGVWDGSFKPAWTNNPVWVYYDLLLHPRYGLGDRINANQIDKWGLYEISQYCDQPVDDGKGGKEPRFTCNMFLQKQADALRVMQDLASIFRGITYWGLGQAIVSADMPRDPVYTYTNANVRGGRFDRKGSKKSTVYSVILSAWSDPADFYRIKYEYVQDDALVAKYGVRSTTLANIGCTSQGQAHRAGKWALLSNKYETNTVTFSVGLEGIKAMPGQVIRIVDQHRQGRRVGGRVRDGSTTTRILVDLLPNINVAVGDALVLNMPDGTSAVRTVSALDHEQNAVTVDAAFPALPVRGAVWAYEAEDLKSELYRVVSVSDGSTPLEYTITALTYTEGKHEAIDFGTIISSRPTVAIPVAIVPTPENVRLSTDYKLDQYQAVTTMTIAWDKVIGAVRYDVEWRRDNGDWIYAGRVASTEVDVIGIYAGVYSARVRAINAVGILSQWAEIGPVDLEGKTDLPPVPVNVTTTSEIFAIRLEWGFPTGAEDTAFTQIQMATGAGGENAVEMGQFSYPTSMYLHSGMAAGVYRWFRLRLIDKTGNVGAWTDWVVGQSSAEATEILDYIQGQITESELGQELLGRIDLIDGDGPGSINDRLSEVRTDLQGQIDDLDIAVAETNTNLNAINVSLQEQIDNIAELADSMPYKADSTYTAGQAVLGANGKLYQANQDVPINTPPPNATYWDDIGQVVTQAGALASRVTTVETAITTINGELSAQSSRIDGLQTQIDGKASNAALTSLTSRVTTAENTITSQGQALTAVQGQVTSLDGQVTALGSSVSSLQTRVTAAEGNISSNSTAITGLQNSLVGKADASTVTSLSNTVTQQGATLTAQGSQLTSIQTSLNNIGGNGTNMLPSEYSWLGDTLPTMLSALVTRSAVAVPESDSGYGYRLVATDTNIFSYAILAPGNTQASFNLRLEPGTYLVSMYIKGDTNGQAMVNLYDAVTSRTATMSYTTTRTRVTFVIAVSAATKAAIYVYPNRQGASGAAITFDSVMIERRIGESNTPSSFTPGPTATAAAALASANQSLAARVTAAEGTITSQGNSITSLQNSVTSLTSTKADASAVTALSNRVTATEASIASQATSITELTSVIGQQPDNLILKGTFEDGTVGPWTADPVISNVSAHPSYSKAITFYGSSFCGTTRNITTRGGEEFDCSADIWNNYMSAGQTTRLQIQFYDKNVTNLGYFTAFTVAAGTNGFQTYSGRITAPVGAVTARFVIRHETSDGVGRSLWCNIVARRVTAADASNASATSALTTRVTAAEGTLTSQSSAVTALQSTVGSIAGNGSNLLEDTYSWLTSTTLPTTISSSGVTKAGVAVSDADSGYGISLGGLATSGSFLMLSPTNSTAGRNIRITNGTYLVSMYIIGSAAGSIAASLFGPGGRISANIPFTTSRTRITLPITVTDIVAAEGVPVSLTLYPNRTQVSGLTVTIDSIMVEKRIGENNTPSPFVAGPSARALTAQATALNSLTTTVTQQGNTLTAQAQSISGLQTSLGNTNAQVSTMNTTLTTLSGQASATNTVRVGIASNGTRYTAGYGVGIDNNNGVVQSTFAVLADQFSIMHSTSGVITTPFAVVGGQVFIKDALISSLAVTNALVGQSISSQNVASWAGLPTTVLTFAGAGALVFRHPTRANTYTTYTTDGIALVVDGVLRVRMGIW